MNSPIKPKWDVKKQKKLILGLLLIGSAISALIYCGCTNWTKTWGEYYFDQGRGVWGDGINIYTTGYSNTDGSSDLILIKWDMIGNQLWKRTWGGSDYDLGYAVWGTGQEIYVNGYSRSYGNGILLKWDTAGNLLWNRSWVCSESNEYGLSGDGSFVYTCSESVIVKWDTAGNIIWSKSITRDIRSLWADGVGNIYACGDIIIKWDQAGNEVWRSSWSSDPDEHGYGIWGSGTALYTCGSYNWGIIKTILIKWDTDGNMVWKKTVGNGTLSRTGTNGAQAIWGSSNALYTCGNLISSKYHSFLVLIKWDIEGRFVWDRYWGDDITSYYSSAIWGDGVSVYTSGYCSDWDDPGAGLVLSRWGSSHWFTGSIDQVMLIIIIIAVVVFTVFFFVVHRLKKKNPSWKISVRSWHFHSGKTAHGKVQEVLYRQQSLALPKDQAAGDNTQTTCRHCGQEIPVMHRQSQFCVYCGKALKV